MFFRRSVHVLSTFIVVHSVRQSPPPQPVIRSAADQVQLPAVARQRRVTVVVQRPQQRIAAVVVFSSKLFFTEVQQTTRPSRKRSAAHQVASSSFRAAKPEVPSPASSSSLGAERFASPPAASGSSSCSSSSSPPPPKRGKKYSLQGHSAEEIAERKKEQNRIAAQRYRTRKTQTLEEGRSEIAYLEERNAELRLEEQEIAAEIHRLKEILVGGV
ncbi:hypothetical protein AAVH_19335 [Aphelenchoides avenae]|nr:hypothetical protein AAVH_19335 [Aphelenchus avenae]